MSGGGSSNGGGRTAPGGSTYLGGSQEYRRPMKAPSYQGGTSMPSNYMQHAQGGMPQAQPQQQPRVVPTSGAGQMPPTPRKLPGVGMTPGLLASIESILSGKPPVSGHHIGGGNGVTAFDYSDHSAPVSQKRYPTERIQMSPNMGSDERWFDRYDMGRSPKTDRIISERSPKYDMYHGGSLETRPGRFR